jgi:hypothetical protein
MSLGEIGSAVAMQCSRVDALRDQLAAAVKEADEAERMKMPSLEEARRQLGERLVPLFDERRRMFDAELAQAAAQAATRVQVARTRAQDLVESAIAAASSPSSRSSGAKHGALRDGPRSGASQATTDGCGRVLADVWVDEPATPTVSGLQEPWIPVQSPGLQLQRWPSAATRRYRSTRDRVEMLVLGVASLILAVVVTGAVA